MVREQVVKGYQAGKNKSWLRAIQKCAPARRHGESVESGEGWNQEGVQMQGPRRYLRESQVLLQLWFISAYFTFE